MDQRALRGSSPARIDDKGRLKVPTIFRGVIHDQKGPDVFVTSLTGECVRIYPMPVWLEIEQKLSQIPGNHPAPAPEWAVVNISDFAWLIYRHIFGYKNSCSFIGY